jgi:hypothetical protein
MPGHAGVMRVLKPRAAVGGRAASRAIVLEIHCPTRMPSSIMSPLVIADCAGAGVGVAWAAAVGADGGGGADPAGPLLGGAAITGGTALPRPSGGRGTLAGGRARNGANPGIALAASIGDGAMNGAEAVGRIEGAV